MHELRMKVSRLHEACARLNPAIWGRACWLIESLLSEVEIDLSPESALFLLDRVDAEIKVATVIEDAVSRGIFVLLPRPEPKHVKTMKERFPRRAMEASRRAAATPIWMDDHYQSCRVTDPAVRQAIAFVSRGSADAFDLYPDQIDESISDVHLES
jgi:hypothetical protein